MAQAELDLIAQEVKTCTKCKLYKSARQGVPGEGPANAEILFIGEGPGFYEDQQGRPFVGASGKFLEELLASIGLKREDVFIANVVKHRPPGNRDPEPDEIKACSGYLDRQIAALQPKVIVTLGRHSMARYFPGAKVSSIHGQARVVDGRLVVAMFHPAAALHQESLRQTVIADFKKLPGYIARAKGQGSPAAPSAVPKLAPPEEPEGPKQLSLF
ncbi:MAG: uracil-DNA glycosylase [Anaerolineales bacterium]|nr:uracil-DNA glycosylase [Anaerolineales bacterium]